MKDLRQRVTLVTVFTIGLFVGVLGMAFLAKHASPTYLEMTRGRFAVEEGRLLREAWQRGDHGSALVRASSVLEVTHGDGAMAFTSDRSEWPLAFPFLAPFAEAIMRPNITPRSRATDESISRALLGNAWERLGHAELANREYRLAVEVGGGTPGQWKEAGARLLSLRVPERGTATSGIPVDELPVTQRK